MDLSLIIAQLRQYCPQLAFVGGSVDFAAGLETTVNPATLPAAFVIPLEDEAAPNTMQNGLRQQVMERVGIVVETDASADRRGQTAAMTVEAAKYSVHAALLNWRIDPIRAQRGLQYAGGRLLHFDRARIFWEYDYELEVTLATEDGFQVPLTPLQEIGLEFGSVRAPVYFFDLCIAATTRPATAIMNLSN